MKNRCKINKRFIYFENNIERMWLELLKLKQFLIAISVLLNIKLKCI